MSNALSQARLMGMILLPIAVIVATFSIYWFAIHERGGGDIPVHTFECRIVILEPDERLRRENASIEQIARTSDSQLHLVSPKEVNNPIILNKNYAVVRVENVSKVTRSLYVVYPGSLFRNPPPARQPTIQATMIGDIDLRGPDGNPVKVISFTKDVLDPSVPTADELRTGDHPTMSLKPGESVELPIDILDSLPSLLYDSPYVAANGSIRPGVYTVTATVSYAESPSGETKRISSEAAKITVTDDHIKEAKTFLKNDIRAANELWNRDKK